MADNDLLELLDSLSLATPLQQGHQILRNAMSAHGVEHVAYGAINLPTERRDRPLTAVSYAAEWERHYLQNGYVNLDPVVRAGLGGILPIDWATLDHDDPIVIRFFGEAQEFRIGKTGLSIPIHGRHNEFALFSVTTDLKESEWEKLKVSHMSDFMLTAYFFHDWAVRTEGIRDDEDIDLLSLREKDCLRWRGLGKSDWDISSILNISERTVKFHLQSARRKLSAANTTHAVAKAMNLGLIVVP